MKGASGIPIIFLIFLTTLLALAQSAIDSAAKDEKNSGKGKVPLQKRVLLIGMDGVLPKLLKKSLDKYRKEKTYPNFVKVFDEGTVDYSIEAGGESGTKTEQPTNPAAGWATILTGVYANEHQILKENDMSKALGKNTVVPPTLFNYISEMFPKAEMEANTAWFQLANLMKRRKKNNIPRVKTHGASSDPYQISQSDSKVSQDGLGQLKSNPIITCLYFGAAGPTGQKYGFKESAEVYMNGIDEIAGKIEPLLEYIEEERKKGSAEWLIIITSSHGGHGTEIGTQKPADRQVFAVFHDPLDRRFSLGGEISSRRGLDVFVPTILDFLANSKWKGIKLFVPGKKPYRNLKEPLEVPMTASHSSSSVYVSNMAFISVSIVIAMLASVLS